MLHTTEGPSITSAVGEFTAHNSWPHLTIDPIAKQAVQHVPLDVAARSLAHPLGTPETNRANCVQIEIVGIATESPTWSSDSLEFIAGWMRMVEEKVPIPRQSGMVFKSYPASAGLANGVRMNAADWAVFSGWCGHQHVPHQDHGDPGDIDIDHLCSPRILGLGSAPSTPGPAAVSRSPRSMDVVLARAAQAPRALSWGGDTWSAAPIQVGDGQVPAGGIVGVAGVARGSDVVDTFWVGADGSLQTAWWTRSAGWSASHLRIGDPAIPATMDGGIAALGRRPGIIDVFFVGLDGRLHTTWWTGPTGWATPTLTLAGTLPVDVTGGVSVVNRTRDILDVFCVGEDGGLYTVQWTANSGWAAAATMIANPLGGVVGSCGCAAVARDHHHVDAVFVGRDAHLYAVRWDETAGWSAHVRIDTGSAMSASTVAGPAMLARKRDVLDVFWLDVTGRLLTTWWTEAHGWSGAAQQLGAPSARMIPTLSPTAIARRSTTIDVFAVDWNYAVNTIGWTASTGWASTFSTLNLTGL
ncbi:hypothetical protein [Geodermatophilus amargosae]|uniref:hypothetical protein n=1 Tax=Geodermatophilus amargosae TaxID=1296565 RepID=UPI001114BCA3|nr:hypothetical protein [Geodermatophilus amargosae]